MNIPYLPLKELNARFAAADQRSFLDVHESGRYIGGSQVEQFELAFAQYCGVEYAISTGNGLDALTIILLAEKQLGILPPDAKILLPAHTYIATFLSIVNAGMQPVPVDVTDLLLVEENLHSQIHKVDAILTVDLYGKMVSDEVYAFTKAQQKPIYCDSAQSHGAQNKQGKRSGSMAKASAFSFYPTKNLGALGDGGAITTSNEELAAMCRKLANYGRASQFENDVKGVNSRLDPLQAAFLMNRLAQLSADNNRRIAIAKKYFNTIKNARVDLPDSDFLNHNAMHVFPVFVENRSDFRTYLSSKNIGTNVHYPNPPHYQQAFKELNDLSFPRTEYLHRTEVSLPCHPLMTDEEVIYISDCINNY